MTDILIVGAGRVGRALGGACLKVGHKISFALREPESAAAADLKSQGFCVLAVENSSASADVIVLAIPWTALPSIMDCLGPLDGKIVIDTTNPLNPDLSLALGHDDSAGETVALLAPKARVVKAFNTTGADNMANSQYPGGKLMMPVAGEDAQAKKIVMSLAADLGFEPIDAGPLAMSHHLEPMAMLWIKLVHAQNMGVNFGFSLLQR